MKSPKERIIAVPESASHSRTYSILIDLLSKPEFQDFIRNQLAILTSEVPVHYKDQLKCAEIAGQIKVFSWFMHDAVVELEKTFKNMKENEMVNIDRFNSKEVEGKEEGGAE